MAYRLNVKKEIILLGVCVLLFVAVNYNYLDSKLEDFLVNTNSKNVDVKRVIDGDTIVYSEKDKEIHVRLLGINAPEKGEKFYERSSEFLKSHVLNESVRLVYQGEVKDKYGRELAYIFIDDENINLQIIRKGYGNYYFPSGRNSYYGEFVKAWKKCIEKDLRLCEGSINKCSDCIKLEKVDKFEQEVVFYNSCSFSCNLTSWSIKDEGRKKFVFPEFTLESDEKVVVRVGEKANTEDILYWKGENYVWTSSGDTLFLRDDKGKLILWEIIN